jgi:5,10-methylenetetrahydrofolate reductase
VPMDGWYHARLRRALGFRTRTKRPDLAVLPPAGKSDAMTFLERLRAGEPMISVEMRPPRVDLASGATIDAWMAMGSAVRRLARQDTAMFFTDNAVGSNEEENLHHLVSNLEDDLATMRICPFLTTKHTLEYCLWYADRAVADGHRALTVLGGDRHVGPPRCVAHSAELRRKIRLRHPGLALGAWANPYHDPELQVGLLLDDDAAADFYLTQIVSHHDIQPVARFVELAHRRGLTLPGVFGVFYYRSPNPRTFAMLSSFIRVPAEQLTRDFRERGLSADEICAATIRALLALGVRQVYVSNLRPDETPEQLAAIRRLLA